MARRSGRVGHEGEAVWRVGSDGLLTVESAYDTITTQLGDMPPEALARMLLAEMIAEAAGAGLGRLQVRLPESRRDEKQEAE